MSRRNTTMVAGAVGACFGVVPTLLLPLSGVALYAWSLPSLMLVMLLSEDSGAMGIVILLLGPVLQWFVSAMLMERAIRRADRFAGACLLLSAAVLLACLWGLSSLDPSSVLMDKSIAEQAMKHRGFTTQANLAVALLLATTGGMSFFLKPPSRRRRRRKSSRPPSHSSGRHR